MKLKYFIILLLAVIVGFNVTYSIASADTTYEVPITATPVPLTVDFPSSGSGVNNRPIYVFAIKPDTNVIFDRIQIEISSATVTRDIYAQMMTLDDNWVYSSSCLNSQISTCNAFMPTPDKTIGYGDPSRKGTTTIEYLFTSTSTFKTNTILYFYFDPNSPYEDLEILTVSNSKSAAMNGNGWIISNTIPVLKLCNGACDNNTFNYNLIPPTRPDTGYKTRFTDLTLSSTTATSSYFIELSEWSTGYKPDYITISSTLNGSSTHNYVDNELILPIAQGSASKAIALGSNAFPVDGTYNVYLTMTSIGGSYVPIAGIGWNVVVTISGGNVTSVVDMPDLALDTEVTWQPCGITEISGCFINAGMLLFVPDTEKVRQFTDLSTTLETKFPFVYVYQFSDAMSDLYTGTPSASSTISYDFAGLGTMTLLSVDLLEDVPFQSWLRTVIGYLMWIMFAILMYNRGLKIFNTNPQ